MTQPCLTHPASHLFEGASQRARHIALKEMTQPCLTHPASHLFEGASLELFGNPMGLIENVASGVKVRPTKEMAQPLSAPPRCHLT